VFYVVANFAIRLVLALFTRCRVEGLHRVPRTGSFLLVSNHLSLVDPPVLGALLPRRVTFMAKWELFGTPVIGWVVKWYGAFGVKRGQADRQALRMATEVLERGGVLGMFPEGTRSKTGELQEAHQGAALVAMATSGTILPVAVTGTEQLTSPLFLLRRPRVNIRIGESFVIERNGPGKARLKEATEQMMGRVAELLPEGRRGYYAAAVRGAVEAGETPGA
jgi:1-acyl-sn-glycerol-3-phosphate acyltransferase